MEYDILLSHWPQVEPKLRANGIDTSKLKPVHQVAILARIASEPIEEVSWPEVADELVEEHPTWETLDHRRRRHAQELVVDDGSVGSGTTSVAELAKHRFAAVTWREGSSGVHVVGDTDREICAFVINMRAQEYQEWLDYIVDLDTGGVYAHEPDFETVITVTFHGESVERSIEQ